MRGLLKARGFTIDEYVHFVARLRHLCPRFRDLWRPARRPATLLPWVSDGLEDWPATIARAERIVAAATRFAGGDPVRIGAAVRQRIAAESGATAEEVERFLEHFVTVRETMYRVQAMGFRDKLKALLGRA